MGGAPGAGGSGAGGSSALENAVVGFQHHHFFCAFRKIARPPPVMHAIALSKQQNCIVETKIPLPLRWNEFFTILHLPVASITVWKNDVKESLPNFLWFPVYQFVLDTLPSFAMAIMA